MSDEYRRGYRDGYRDGIGRVDIADIVDASMRETSRGLPDQWMSQPKRKPRKRKLSAWNKFVKANSKKKRFIYQSGSKRGKLNLRKMGIAFRKTPAGRKKR